MYCILYPLEIISARASCSVNRPEINSNSNILTRILSPKNPIRILTILQREVTTKHTRSLTHFLDKLHFINVIHIEIFLFIKIMIIQNLVLLTKIKLTHSKQLKCYYGFYEYTKFRNFESFKIIE